jgi:hypothetical protein
MSGMPRRLLPCAGRPAHGGGGSVNLLRSVLALSLYTSVDPPSTIPMSCSCLKGLVPCDWQLRHRNDGRGCCHEPVGGFAMRLLPPYPSSPCAEATCIPAFFIDRQARASRTLDDTAASTKSDPRRRERKLARTLRWSLSRNSLHYAAGPWSISLLRCACNIDAPLVSCL